MGPASLGKDAIFQEAEFLDFCFYPRQGRGLHREINEDSHMTDKPLSLLRQLTDSELEWVFRSSSPTPYPPGPLLSIIPSSTLYLFS